MNIYDKEEYIYGLTDDLWEVYKNTPKGLNFIKDLDILTEDEFIRRDFFEKFVNEYKPMTTYRSFGKELIGKILLDEPFEDSDIYLCKDTIEIIKKISAWNRWDIVDIIDKFVDDKININNRAFYNDFLYYFKYLKYHRETNFLLELLKAPYYYKELDYRIKRYLNDLDIMYLFE